jgi:hypothetical protein
LSPGLVSGSNCVPKSVNGGVSKARSPMAYDVSNIR